MERRGDSRDSQTLRAMYPRRPQWGDDWDATHGLTQVSRSHPTDRLPASALPETDESERTVIIPAQRQRSSARIPAAPQTRRPPAPRWYRPVAFVAVLVVLVGAVGYQIVQATHQPLSAAASVPAPSGHGPWTTSNGSVLNKRGHPSNREHVGYPQCAAALPRLHHVPAHHHPVERPPWLL